jgi:tRNA uridine 5-carbamoylmethylation protein Kti12
MMRGPLLTVVAVIVIAVVAARDSAVSGLVFRSIHYFTLHPYRIDHTDRYSDKLMDELIMRFECPDSSHRWDRPLFTVEPHESLPFDEICAALFAAKSQKTNFSALPEPMTATCTVYEMDRCTNDIITVGVLGGC